MAKFVEALPKRFSFDPRKTALIIIDMQRDFVSPRGWAAARNDLTHVRKIIAPIRKMVAAAREAGMTIVFTREGHKPDLSNAPKRKIESLPKGKRIGDKGPMGRFLVWGEEGHGIINELRGRPSDIVIDKPGKDSFYKTNLESVLEKRGVTHLLLAGVTTNVCVLSTAIGAHDRGFHPVVLKDCVAAYKRELHSAALKLIPYEAGIYGSVASSRKVMAALKRK